MNTDFLRARLKLRHFASERQLLRDHPLAAGFYQRIGVRPGKIREQATRLLASGALAGTLFLSPPAISPVVNAMPLSREIRSVLDAQSLRAILPPVGQWELTADQQNQTSKFIKENFGIQAVAQLEGNKLNNQYGRMGAEQHLARFPGDYVENMAPGLGAWGYVSDFDVEKYYVAVQTLYLPDWNSRTKYLVDWYKYRRMVAVNPANGRAMVVAVADAGPANWTGKHFGGSPEVMAYLGINYGMQNHPVILFFLDDPLKKVPLGPLEYNHD